MTVWRNLSLTPTARALATSYAREDNTLHKSITIAIIYNLLLSDVLALQVGPHQPLAAANLTYQIKYVCM